MDKGFYTSENITDLKELGIRRVCIPKAGRLTIAERRHKKKRWFKQL
jgi:hypothetical protein